MNLIRCVVVVLILHNASDELSSSFLSIHDIYEASLCKKKIISKRISPETSYVGVSSLHKFYIMLQMS